MLRIIFLSLSFLFLSCSKHQPSPVAPAGKAADLGNLFDLFNQAQSEPESESPADTSQVAAEDDPPPLEEDTLPETETDVDFNIEIVFLDDFDPDRRAWIEETASQ